MECAAGLVEIVLLAVVCQADTDRAGQPTLAPWNEPAGVARQTAFEINDSCTGAPGEVPPKLRWLLV